MATKIVTASVCNQVGVDKSIEYSARAGRACIERSLFSEADIGLLLSVGVYRESNIHEPALGSLIQGRIGLNGSVSASQIGQSHGATLSFDVLNGACGFFSALDVADSFIDSGMTSAALVVASDVHPAGRRKADFPYDHCGAAVLLARSEDGSGFRDLIYKTSDDEYTGNLVFTDVTKSGARAELEFEVEADFAERFTDFVVASIAEYFERSELRADQLKYVVLPSHPCDVRPVLIRLLGFEAHQFIDVSGRYGKPFTCLPIVGYCAALEAGLDRGDRVLIVSAGAGLTFACGVYHA